MKKNFACVVVLLILATFVQIAGASSYWERMSQGFSNQVVVYDYGLNFQSPELEVSARVPQLMGAGDLMWQAQFNTTLREKLKEFAAELQAIAAYDDQRHPYQGIVDFEVKLNRGGLLSIAVQTYSYTGGAHGMTTVEYLNLDLTTGQELSFNDLFPSEAEIERAAQAIDAEIAANPEWFFIDQFSSDLFTEHQGFYLQDHHVVVCFGLYELAPYVAGIQEFAVSAP